MRRFFRRLNFCSTPDPSGLHFFSDQAQFWSHLTKVRKAMQVKPQFFKHSTKIPLLVATVGFYFFYVYDFAAALKY